MSEPAIDIRGVGKMYKIFPTRTDNFLDALGMGNLFPWRRAVFREFWALRDINITVEHGSRIGLIGRNGAGKSTLLKLITGNLPVTEGHIRVDGQVQALLEAGGGLHPEFTGYENIRAALTYQGLSAKEIGAATEDIVAFTELDEFLTQPFKNYSLGMQARLAFAIATSVKPEILIVDEMLGAGDAYFFTKSIGRMSELINSGASVLIVSHALDQIVRFCEHVVWLDRGRIVMEGKPLDVVKAYDKHIRELEDKRLKAKNEKRSSPRYSSDSYDAYADAVAIRVTAEDGCDVDVTELELLADGRREDGVLLGAPQDSDSSQSAFLVSGDAEAWSPPFDDHGQVFRRISPQNGSAATGSALFHLFALMPRSTYEVGISYRATNRGRAYAEVIQDGAVASTADLAASDSWTSLRLPVRNLGSETVMMSRRDTEVPSTHLRRSQSSLPSRWPGEGSLTIQRVQMVGHDDDERAVFEAGTIMAVRVTFAAVRSDSFRVVPVAVLFRLDGVLVSRFIGDPMDLDLEASAEHELVLDLGDINLGNGHYVFSIALYRALDLSGIEEPEIYDLIDRSYEFQVVGVEPLRSGVFQHSGTWHVT